MRHSDKLILGCPAAVLVGHDERVTVPSYPMGNSNGLGHRCGRRDINFDAFPTKLRDELSSPAGLRSILSQRPISKTRDLNLIQFRLDVRGRHQIPHRCLQRFVPHPRLHRSHIKSRPGAFAWHSTSTGISSVLKISESSACLAIALQWSSICCSRFRVGDERQTGSSGS